ncbi:MAG: response regulator [Phycisphaerales bacterium]
MVPANIDCETLVILLVDDDADCRMLIRDAIESSGGEYEVYECRDGEDGLAFLKRESEYEDAPRPSIVFLDLEMPGKNGHQVLVELRSMDALRDLPVVMLTGVDSDEAERIALQNGANSYTCKSADPEALFDVVTEATKYWTRVHRPIRSTAA